MTLHWPEVKTGTEFQSSTITITHFKMGEELEKTATIDGISTSLTNSEIKDVTLDFINENKSLFKDLSKL